MESENDWTFWSSSFFNDTCIVPREKWPYLYVSFTSRGRSTIVISLTNWTSFRKLIISVSIRTQLVFFSHFMYGHMACFGDALFPPISKPFLSSFPLLTLPRSATSLYYNSNECVVISFSFLDPRSFYFGFTDYKLENLSTSILVRTVLYPVFFFFFRPIFIHPPPSSFTHIIFLYSCKSLFTSLVKWFIIQVKPLVLYPRSK